jgi:hypothetical protein
VGRQDMKQHREMLLALFVRRSQPRQSTPAWLTMQGVQCRHSRCACFLRDFSIPNSHIIDTIEQEVSRGQSEPTGPRQSCFGEQYFSILEVYI